jgi:ABC-type branched-subunit amino acid transport system substrate-binding protein
LLRFALLGAGEDRVRIGPAAVPHTQTQGEHRMKTLRIVATGLAAAALFAAVGGCGSKSSDSGSGSGSSGGGSIKGGPGITDKTISLGVLTDLSGVFAPYGQPGLQGHQLFWKQQNAKGGVCNRTVKLIVKDHGYDPQKAVVQYRDLAPKVAAMQQLLGSPITAALLPTLKTDRMFSVLSSWASSLLANDFLLEVGAPYELEMINGLDYFKDKGLIKSGDKIGDVYFEGEYGEAGLAGVKYWASKNGATVVEQKIQATDEDMSGQVVALKRAGVKAIAMTTGPKQLASVAGIAASTGLGVPILGENPTFDPALLASPAAKALIANAYIVGPVDLFSSDNAATKAVSDAYLQAYGKKAAKAVVQLGYAQSKVMYDILDKACANKDLSREGLIKAAHQITVDTSGLVAGPLDYTKIGEPPTRADYLARPANVIGGLKSLGKLESDTAKNWTVGS